MKTATTMAGPQDRAAQDVARSDVTFVNCTADTFSPTAGAAISIWLWEVCQAARRAGVEPMVISKESSAEAFPWPRTISVPFPDRSKNPIVHFVSRAQKKLGGWRYLRQRRYVIRVAEAIKEAGMQSSCVVLHNDPEAAIYLRRLLPRARIMLIFHNSDAGMRSAFRGDLSRDVDVVMAVSSAAARAIEHAYALPEGTVKAIYNGVDLEQFHPAEQPKSDLPIINFTGRLRPDKSPDIVLKAAVVLSESTRDFAIQLLGTSQLQEGQIDDYERGIRELIKTLELRGIDVRLTGHVDRRRIAEEVRKASIHVTPSRKQEEFGLATIEGMASGLATVASKTGGTPEVVGDAGFLFDSESITQLAEQLKALVLDQELRATYGQKARQRAEQFTWDRTWARLMELASA